MPRSLSRARCAFASSLLNREHAGRPAKWIARTERRGATSRTRVRTGR